METIYVFVAESQINKTLIMKATKQTIGLLPEIIILTLVILYWTQTYLLNPVAIGLFAVISLKILLRNTIVDFISVGILLFTSIFILLAVLSEYHEFTVKNDSVQNLLYFGLLLFGLVITSSIFMGISSIKRIS